jgi:hypothetical protein
MASSSVGQVLFDLVNDRHGQVLKYFRSKRITSFEIFEKKKKENKKPPISVI